MEAKEPDGGRVVGTQNDSQTAGGEGGGAASEGIAEATHEINNFLTGILGQAQLMRREELSATAQRRLATIEQLARRIKDSITKISSP